MKVTIDYFSLSNSVLVTCDTPPFPKAFHVDCKPSPFKFIHNFRMRKALAYIASEFIPYVDRNGDSLLEVSVALSTNETWKQSIQVMFDNFPKIRFEYTQEEELKQWQKQMGR